MTPWYRVFGADPAEPKPSELSAFLKGLCGQVEGHFRGDEFGWTSGCVQLGDTLVFAERYLVSEDGIRADLNSWAAWVESVGETHEQVRLMGRLIGSQQLIVLRDLPA